MKAVIVDLNRIYAAALSDDGCIKKVINKNYAIGQVIEMKKSFSFKGNRVAKYASIAAAFLLVCGVGAFTYYHPNTYVSLDVNPSIEYSLNMYDRVLSVKGVNDDGTEILSELSLENLGNKTIDDAIALTVEEIAKQGYFDGDIAGEIVITASGKDLKKAAELANELKAVSEHTCERNNYNVAVMAEGVGKERVEEAKALGITPGKLNLIQKLQASTSDPESIDVSEWAAKSVKDIQKATKANRISSTLTEEQLALITPALDTFKTEMGTAYEAFNTAFDALKTDYLLKIEAAKTEIAIPEELEAKLDELKESMLTERRAIIDTLTAAIETAKTAFLQTTSTLEIEEDILKDYIEYVVDQEIETKEGFKEFCKAFESDDDNTNNDRNSEKSENKADESKANDNRSEHGNKDESKAGRPDRSESKTEIEESEMPEVEESEEEKEEAEEEEPEEEFEVEESEVMEIEESETDEKDNNVSNENKSDRGENGKSDKNGR